MAKNSPAKMRQADLIRLLNSTPLGQVIDGRRLRRHFDSAGYRIGDKDGIDLLRYAAWLWFERQRVLAAKEKLQGYGAVKERAAARSKVISGEGRDIGEMPGIVDPGRRDHAEQDFRFFCQEYFPQTFYLAWSPDHLKVIAKVEQAVMHGGLFAMAMPRGSGKTTIAECACLWAVLYGHSDFVCLIGATEGHSAEMLDSIKTELNGNDILGDDFPEVCFPISALEGIANRCTGQLYKGERTHIGWTAKEIVLPSIPGSSAAGAIIKVAGITGQIRGMKYKRPDGDTARPSLVVIDDPQTDESARSMSQSANRESILAGAVLGMAGPGKKISGIMPCTVIRPGDMADNILDRGKHPEWNGERTKMVYAFPENEKLWETYAELRADSLRMHGDIREATKFYRNNRAAMEAGAKVSWEERYRPDEVSALQHAMNLKLQDEAAFFAEYQNEPVVEADYDDEEMLTADQIAQKLNGYKARETPTAAEHLTMFIDVQGKLLFYVVAAWSRDFTGYVVDYGTYPDQKKRHFKLRGATRTLGRAAPGTGLEGSIFAGLEALTGEKLGREWEREDGAKIKIERCLIDANWGTSTDVVYQFCRRSPYSAVLTPSHGRYVGASSKSFDEYKRQKGDRIGHNWRVPGGKNRRSVRYVLYDTNYWKSFIHARLAVAMGDKGSLSLFGRDPHVHRLLAEHLTSEYRVKTEGRGRVVDEWKLRPDESENHWFDCLVGCAVAASLTGNVALGEMSQVKRGIGRVGRKNSAPPPRLVRGKGR